MRRRSFLAGATACLALSPADARAAVERQDLMVFPRDHGAHPDARLEWWYLTGWLGPLEAPGAPSIGVQLTFFRLRTAVAPTQGRYSPGQLIVAHAAIADPSRGALMHDQGIQRISPPLVAAAVADTDLKLDHWRFERDAASGTYRANIPARSFELKLGARPTQALLPQGAAGWSRKGPSPDTASWYYSTPQLALEARLKQRGSTVTLVGTGWLDHEWSDAILDPRAAGWDWIGMNLDDGGALTAFQIRPRTLGPALWSYASLRDVNGKVALFGLDQVTFSGLTEWRSPRTGATYPVAQRVRVGDRTFETRPLMNDQELDSSASTGAVYWEGASTLIEGGKGVGRGYLEMTGYLAPLRFL